MEFDRLAVIGNSLIPLALFLMRQPSIGIGGHMSWSELDSLIEVCYRALVVAFDKVGAAAVRIGRRTSGVHPPSR